MTLSHQDYLLSERQSAAVERPLGASLAPLTSDPLPPPPSSGTHYTPKRLAEVLVRRLRPTPEQLWLEPCVGDGAFLRALNHYIDPRQITAVDLETAESPSDKFAGRVLRGEDFLKWAKHSDKRFERIVANPPYVSLSQVPPGLREAALATHGLDGKPVRLGANYWVAFLCASLRLLKPGGSIGFILPASFEYADYAAPIRAQLINVFAVVEVHRCRKPMFDSISDGCVVLIAHGYSEKGRLVRYEYGTLEELVANEPIAEFDTGLIKGAPARGLVLGDALEIRLGGVTGDASYFLLNDEERIRHALPLKAVVPVLSRAHHLPGGQITGTTWDRLRREGHRVWLFRPTVELARSKPVKRYLELPEGRGGCHRKRYKIKGREPWYQTPMPSVADGFISGMSRHGVWICLNRTRAVSATNTLYVVRFLKARTLERRAAYALALLTSQVRKALHLSGRLYPEGLFKFEPGDLSKLEIPEPPLCTGAMAAHLEATKKLLAGQPSEASRIADSWFSKKN